VDPAKESVGLAPKHRWDVAESVVDEKGMDMEVLRHAMELYLDLILD
jgi:hypothetical protein